MSKGEQLIRELVHTTIVRQGGQFGVRSAFIGSIVFALIDLAAININTYLIQHIDAPLNIVFSAGWTVFLILLGSALAYLPALLLGRLLANWLHKDAGRSKLSRKSAFVKGALLGAIAGIVICAPLFVSAYIFIWQYGHGDFWVFAFRASEVTLIAMLAAGWTGIKVEQCLSRKYTA